ncbi:hypothetical protein Q666_11695 [Marinobacter sp. ES-1]|jgi:histidinol-phosphate aminotransferase|uniref:histidinol-phosphate transaminase n=1 Tax=Pseudomonas putida TaxID=303 RepID=A0A1L7NGL5_PSEPU|nr:MULTISPECIES: aminotransferase class I/II-fold pyridoxal phosphate-dependent enzyme [Gammaproteobacteria]ALG87880.1 Histidinol-phosphate aminotransferase [uncultured bacterium]MCL4780251.1 aminotransferase class I/II-fold pyridoxal phosphate-dependent enzyme [Gammaproteobacteria bacterium]MDZ3309213.1 aminotransferase class I/II-fold pyridoxal phosphate-dependent enzyme [Klebsiella pneumoniae]HAY4753520.1 aminotransferase class I/II-fold pyridoxal phosphate-dependent enzyme [Escherichia coli|tara:strand:- start:594 stop:1187 length:594 start_codon:yes stop_codon:yes gene_type:complete
MSGTFDSPRLRNLKPYTPGEQSGGERLVKLNANENPYPPSPLAVAAMMEAVKSGLELYLDPNAGLVRENVASYYGLSDDKVFVGNGSDEVLALAFCAFFQQENRPLLFADVTYSFYEVYCQLYSITYELIPVDEALVLQSKTFRKILAGYHTCNSHRHPLMTASSTPVADLGSRRTYIYLEARAGFHLFQFPSVSSC